MANEFVIKNGYFSQGNSTVTGSLSVTQNITASKALFSSSGVNQLMVIGSGSSSWLTGIYGSQGNLLTVTDSMSGSLFTVADISGYPILDVTSDYYTSTIQMVGTASLTGSLSITKNLEVKQNITASKALISSSGNKQLMVMGSGSSSWITGIYGSQGNIFTATDTFSGSIFTVTDISGYPILDVTSNYYTNSVYLPTLQSQSQQYVISYNSQSGLLSYMSSSAIGGSGNPFPYTGSAEITGSLIVSGGFFVHALGGINQTVINSDSTLLIDTLGATSIDWSGRSLTDGSGVSTLSWGTGFLNDISNNLSLDWPNRALYYNDGTTEAINWNTLNQITIDGDVLPAGPYTDNTSSWNLGSPTAAWNEIYVSNNSLYFVSGSVSASIGFNNGIISFNDATVNIPSGSTVQTASFAQTASFLTPGTYRITSSWAQSSSQALTASYTLSSSYALTASYALNGGSGGSGGSTTSLIATKYMGFGNTLTGSSLQISASYNLFIPANTFTVGDVIRVNCLYSRGDIRTSAASYIWYITGSTTPFSYSVAGATLLATYNVGINTGGGVAMSRLLYISSSTNTEIIPVANGNLFSDEHQSLGNLSWGGSTSSLNIDWTTDKWIVFAFQHNAPATATIIKVYRCMATKV